MPVLTVTPTAMPLVVSTPTPPATPTFAQPIVPTIQAVVPENAVVWPSDTELIYVAGTTKVMLTAQRPVMRTVIQDAFENVHASLLFNCAFPDASVIPSIIRDGLVAAAWSNVPRASNIHGRLLVDEEYIAKMSRLVSPFIGKIGFY
jgi:hypothetical protein